MTEESHLVKAASDDVGLRRESTVAAGDIPVWLARVHRALPVGATVRLSIAGDPPLSTDDLLEGAGFRGPINSATRSHSLPDAVRPRMRMLVCGLNPGETSATEGVSFAKAGNRFWPAALAAGLVSADRDVEHALFENGVGFTDLAKRTSTRADEITRAEFRAGASRVHRLVQWLQPERFVMVGLTGWRAAVDRSAVAGRQDRDFGGVPTYVMPNTSGLNARTTLDELVEHLVAAQELVPSGRSE